MRTVKNSYPSAMFSQKRRQLVHSILRQQRGYIKHQITQIVLAAMLGQSGTERKESNDFSPRNFSVVKKLFCELVESDFQVRVSVDAET